MRAVHGHLNIAKQVDARRDRLAASIGPLTRKLDSSHETAEGDRWQRNVRLFGGRPRWSSFGEPDLAEHARAVHHLHAWTGQAGSGSGGNFGRYRVSGRVHLVLAENGKGADE